MANDSSNCILRIVAHPPSFLWRHGRIASTGVCLHAATARLTSVPSTLAVNHRILQNNVVSWGQQQLCTVTRSNTNRVKSVQYISSNAFNTRPLKAVLIPMTNDDVARHLSPTCENLHGVFAVVSSSIAKRTKLTFHPRKKSCRL